MIDFDKELSCGVYPTKGINWERLKTLDNKMYFQNLMNYNVNFIALQILNWTNGFADYIQPDLC